MAEIRKYDPSKGNAIAEALRAAMGDPIRPATPDRRRPISPANLSLPPPRHGSASASSRRTRLRLNDLTQLQPLVAPQPSQM